MASKPKAQMGRPTKYKAEFAEQAYKYCLLGADDKAGIVEIMDDIKKLKDQNKSKNKED